MRARRQDRGRPPSLTPAARSLSSLCGIQTPEPTRASTARSANDIHRHDRARLVRHRVAHRGRVPPERARTDRCVGRPVRPRRRPWEKNRIVSRIDREVALALKLADDPVVRQWSWRKTTPACGCSRSKSWKLPPRLLRPQLLHRPARVAALLHPHGDGCSRGAAASRPRPARAQPTRVTSPRCATSRASPSMSTTTGSSGARRSGSTAVLRDEAGRKIGLCGNGLRHTDFTRTVVRSPGNTSTTILVDGRGIIQPTRTSHTCWRTPRRRGDGKATVYDQLGRAGDAGRCGRPQRAVGPAVSR